MTATAPSPLPPGPIDPRIRQRRIEVRRDEGRRRLRILVAMASILTVAVLAYVVLESGPFTVRRVTVAGVTGTRAIAARAVLAGQVRRPLVDVDAGALDHRLEALPWVRTATVSRRWPSGLDVSIAVRVPVAQVVAGAGRWARLDATGRVVATGPGPVPGLLTLSGLPPAGRPGSRLRQALALIDVAERLPADVRSKVQAVGTGQGGGVSLQMTGGASVNLGTPDALAAKFAALSTLLNQVDMSGVRTIDVRLPNLPVLTRG